MENKLSIRYAGGAAEFGIDALDASLALEGLANFSIRISRSIYGEDARYQVILTDLSRGSSLFELILQSAPVVAGISHELGLLPSLYKEAIDLLLHLKGKPPKSVKKADRGSVFVENNEGEINVYNLTVKKLIVDADVGRESAKFLGRPLQEVAEKIELKIDGEPIARLSAEDADCFRSVATAEELLDSTAEVFLTVKTIQLEGDGQWKFLDGRGTIIAPIQDEKFLERIEQGERFGKGDTLRVRLRSVQARVNGKLVAKHIIEKVINHEQAETQGKLI